MTVQKTKPKEWEKENIRLYSDEAADREFTKTAAECSSDSDLLRQALRYTEQLVEDFLVGRKTEVRRSDGKSVSITLDDFRDSKWSMRGESIRHSLMLHKTAKPRIEHIREKLKLEDVSEVSRFALRFFYRLARELNNGGRIFVTDKNGSPVEVRFGSLSGKTSKNVDDGDTQPLPQSGGVSTSAKRPAIAAASATSRLKKYSAARPDRT